MASIRIGLGSDFNLNNSNLGLGVTNPQVRLDVDGTVKSKDFEVTGVTSFTAYEGFLRSDHQIDGDLTLKAGQGLNASLSGEIIVKDGVTVTVGAAVGLGTTEVGIGTDNSVGVGTTTNQKRTTTIDSNVVNLAGGSEIECLKVYNTFTPPNGGINERPYAPKPGELYYNYDFKTIEFFDGYGWRQVDNTTRSGRGLFGGGAIGPAQTTIVHYITISTLGNAQHFGDLRNANRFVASCASGTRAIMGAGTPSANTDYFTFASKGNGVEFTTITQRTAGTAASSSTRGLFAGGYNPSMTSANMARVHKIEIATVGAEIDFADLFTGRYSFSSVSNGTRAIQLGGALGSVVNTNLIDSITISSGGQATRFGTASRNIQQTSSACSSTRGVFAGGGHVPVAPTIVFTDKIDYITMATEGNAITFGDATTVATQRNNGASSPTRGVFGGGADPDGNLNVMEYVNIASLGNAIDFGDLGQLQRALTGCSDSHGGLGGF